ncbi:MAG: hypothetical protein RLN70_07645 [Rhodospirillaceae bacterium]
MRIGLVILAALAGCQPRMTLEEAQALCEAQGGMLSVIYTQEITRSRIGKPVGTPGECVLPDEFGARAPAPSNAPPPAN